MLFDGKIESWDVRIQLLGEQFSLNTYRLARLQEIYHFLWNVKFHYHDHFLQLLYSPIMSITAKTESARFSDSVKSLPLDQEQVPCAAVNLFCNVPFAIKSLNHDARIFTAAL